MYLMVHTGMADVVKADIVMALQGLVHFLNACRVIIVMAKIVVA